MRVQVTRDEMTLDLWVRDPACAADPLRNRPTVALVVWTVFGRQDPGVVEQAFELNPGLAAMGAVMPVGTYVELPEPQAPKPALRETVQLWS